jgi:hypothetical protein
VLEEYLRREFIHDIETLIERALPRTGDNKVQISRVGVAATETAQMADRKLDDAVATGAALVLGGDLGCLLALAGRAQRRGLPLSFRHVAEVLADLPDLPPIGEAP